MVSRWRGNRRCSLRYQSRSTEAPRGSRGVRCLDRAGHPDCPLRTHVRPRRDVVHRASNSSLQIDVHIGCSPRSGQQLVANRRAGTKTPTSWPLLPRHVLVVPPEYDPNAERCPSGLRGSPDKRLNRFASVPWVQIPPSPLLTERTGAKTKEGPRGPSFATNSRLFR